MLLSVRLKNGLRVLAIAAVAAVLGYGVARYLNSPPAAVQIPASAPDFALRDLSGRTYNLAEWRGKLVLLNFWATWCPPCLKEIPLFVEFQRRYAGQGLQIVGISVDSPDAVARYWQEHKINYPLLLADDNTPDLMAAYGNSHGSLPYSVLILPDGGVANVKLGAFEHKELEILVSRLLPGPKPARN